MLIPSIYSRKWLVVRQNKEFEGLTDTVLCSVSTRRLCELQSTDEVHSPSDDSITLFSCSNVSLIQTLLFNVSVVNYWMIIPQKHTLIALQHTGFTVGVERLLGPIFNIF